MRDSGMSGVFAGYSSKSGMVGNYAMALSCLLVCMHVRTHYDSLLSNCNVILYTKNTKDNKHEGSDNAVQEWSGWQASVDPCGSISTSEGDGQPLE